MPDTKFLLELMERYKCPIWITRNGDYIPVTIMSDNHLLNSYRMVRNQIYSGFHAYSTIDSFLSPDTEAYYHAHLEQENWLENALPVLKYQIRILDEEIKRRGIPISENM